MSALRRSAISKFDDEPSRFDKMPQRLRKPDLSAQ